MKRFFPAIILTLATLFFPLLFSAQELPYVTPKEPEVRKKLEAWGDWKFGLLMHWGTYSQWGIVESWSLCSEDEGWCERRGPYAENYVEYVKAYEALQKTFNPVDFDPSKWASAAQAAGMKYVVFTTKHHDGFCMFDTHETDYKITSAQCPYHSNPKADVTRAIFEAFRQKGFGIGAYFSKPDWHNNDYWWRRFATPDRNVNYNPLKYPEKWQQYKDFTFRQLKELASAYGPLDILWLDGGWVRPKTDKMPVWATSPYNQDIDMANIARMARGYQPGLIIVDRSVGGEFENYRTPEQEIPEKPLSYPWETCMTMAGSWSYVPGDHYKSTHQLIHTLVDIVAKGGNLLLNIAPGPDGKWDDTAYQRLSEIGDWMRVNGEAIYGTKPLAPYKEGKICFTQKKDGSSRYGIYLAEEGEDKLPSELMFQNIQPAKGQQVYLLGFASPLEWKIVNRGILIFLPKKGLEKAPCQHAWVFKVL